MTEAKWLAATDPGPILDYLDQKASNWKLQLSATACFRSVWQHLCDERNRRAVETAKRFAKGLDGLINQAWVAVAVFPRQVRANNPDRKLFIWTGGFDKFLERCRALGNILCDRSSS